MIFFWGVLYRGVGRGIGISGWRCLWWNSSMCRTGNIYMLLTSKTVEKKRRIANALKK